MTAPTQLIWSPPEGDPLTFETGRSAQRRLRMPTGINVISTLPLTVKAPSQQGVSALDIAVPQRIVGVQGWLQDDDRAALLTDMQEVDRAFAQQPVRFGGSLELGLLTLVRDGLDDREIDALAQSVSLGFTKAPGIGTFDAEWLCPYPWWRDTEDTTLTVPDTTSSITGVAATNVITASDHDLAIGDSIKFTSLTGGTGLTVGTTYYVIASSFTSSAFKVSATLGGAEIDFTTAITNGTIKKVSVAANTGDVDAPIFATLYGAATEVTLTNEATGEAFTVAVTLADGDRLEVDTTPGQKSITKVTSGGTRTNAMSGLDLTSPRLFALRPGNSALMFSAVGSGANTRAVIAWRNRYGGA